jgi:hypothetical protein
MASCSLSTISTIVIAFVHDSRVQITPSQEEDVSNVRKATFNAPDEVRDAGSGEGAVVEIGGVKFLRMTLPPGWRWSTDVKPKIGTDSCQAHHVGTMIAGTMHVKNGDGSEEEYSAGDLYDVPPGHDAWIVGDEVAVALDVTGGESWAKTS